MKVLFAVSNDNITTSVVKKYQQKYKEIITNKNVYYFNAIVKELQKDKTYDAIVIEEDLEPISNNNYEAIDRFLTEKLDSISDEAGKPTGEDIPIIFICADRRTVSDKLLIKLFSMGIYNALIGNDRSLDKLCELIAKPRNKKDAKKYYKIETDKAEYQSQKDEIVSEDQIQNILNYYKKIGSNERKCVQAFDSISKQYDSTQLRIIVKFLPMDVKAILEARSPVYQRLMSNGTVLSNGQYSAYTPNNPKKPEKLGFVSKDLNTSSAKPRSVVIPTNMKVQEREEIPEENSGYTSQYGVAQQRMNQTYGQYNQNPYGVQNGMGQYNPYNQMRQNPYGNMYGQMHNNNPYGMGNTMGQQMNPNRMQQQRTAYNNYQQNYGMNNNYQQNMNQQGMQTQNQFNQNMNTNNNGFSQQGGLNQNNQNQQSRMNNQQPEIDNVQNDNLEHNLNNTQLEKQAENNIQSQQIDNNTVQTQQSENNIVQAQQPGNDIVQTQQNENNMEQIQRQENSVTQFQQAENNMVQTPQEETIASNEETNNQLTNKDENTSLLKQEESQELIKNDDTTNSLAEVAYTPVVEDNSIEQEVVEPVKRRRGRPRKIRPAEENTETVPVVKRRRGRPRKIAITEEAEIVEPEVQIDEVKNTEQSTQLQQQEQSKIEVNNDFAQPQAQQSIQQSQPQQQIKQQPVAQNNEQLSQINPSEPNSTIPFKTNSIEAIVEDEQDNDVSLNDLKSGNNSSITNTMDSQVANSNNEEQQLYRKPDEIKPINLYDLDIDSEDMFGDNQNVDLGVEPINEYRISEEQQEIEDTPISQLKQNDNQTVSSYMNENTDLISQQRKNNDYDISSPIAGTGKIVAFVGTSKNGTSFIINNVALLLAESGINTAVVDLTKNKNSYYMFTDNDAGKTKIATESLSKLSNGIVEGLNVKNNLTIFTALPENHEEDTMNPRTVLESLNNRFDVVLLDCDFKTHEAYFAFANEIFLTQSMDAFTIQPLTKFLSDLKLKNILDENKLRIVINKYVKLKKLDAKMIVGGMSKYNEPSMTLQRDLFDPKKVKVITIPFDNQTYTKYLESIALCQVSVNGYSKDVVEGLEKIKNLVYPLVAGNSRGNRNTNTSNYASINNLDYNNQRNSQGFSNNMNDTLNKMRTNNF